MWVKLRLYGPEDEYVEVSYQEIRVMPPNCSELCQLQV